MKTDDVCRQLQGCKLKIEGCQMSAGMTLNGLFGQNHRLARKAFLKDVLESTTTSMQSMPSLSHTLVGRQFERPSRYARAAPLLLAASIQYS